uniref:SRCR domain-containing protein n=1 Tax=Amphiprion ocellaris TaxID=80972 RepID=A0A3Q1BPR4_AMPOC
MNAGHSRVFVFTVQLSRALSGEMFSPNIEPSDLLSPPADSVRLENETHLCSGRLQVKWNQVWSSVCSDGFDLQDAEVVCRELGCGSPSGFEGKLYGEAPEWNTEFLCGGHESGLLHCDHSDRDTCSPGTTITLTCSGRWKHLQQHSLNLKAWLCLFTLRCCFHPDPGRVRLVEGSGRCDGTLELRNWGEWRPVWSSVCSDGFDLQDAEVVCRELGCEWNTEFLCGGHESGLLHCDHSDRDTCSPGTTITLTCSGKAAALISVFSSFSNPDDVRLVGGASRCAGRLEMKHDGVWRAMKIQNPDWNLNVAAVICGRLNCGPAVSAVNRPKYPQEDGLGSVRPVWFIRSSCFQSAVSLQDCLVPSDEAKNSLSLQVICSGNNSFSSRRLRSSWAPTSASSAPPGLSIQEVPSSSSSPPPAQRSTTSFQLSHIGPFSCFLLQKTSTEGRTPVFTTSTFSPITSPPPASPSISSPQVASESRRGIEVLLSTQTDLLRLIGV